LTLALLGTVPACVRDQASTDELDAVARGAALRRAWSFIAAVWSADPDEINKHLADGLAFRPYPAIEAHYSFHWKDEKVIGPLRLEYFGDPKTFNLTIEEGGEKIRISIIGRLRYDYFIPTSEGVSYGSGEIGEILADLKGGVRRLERAARWLQTHPRPELVPDLVEMSDGHYEVKEALRAITFQRLWRKAGWVQWFEANGSKSREEWRTDAREKCLGQLRSDNLSARIEGAECAKVIGGMEEDVRKALTFPDEAYVTSTAKDENGYSLVITNRSPRAALIAVTGDRCAVTFSMNPAKPDGPRIGGGRSRASLPVQYHLRILKPGESLVKRFKLPERLVPGDYLFKVSRRDAMNGRTYETDFILIIP